jgi:hypothetical protein
MVGWFGMKWAVSVGFGQQFGQHGGTLGSKSLPRLIRVDRVLKYALFGV